MNDKQDLIGPLAHWLAAGRLEPRIVVPVMQKFAAGSAQPISFLALLDALDEETDEAVMAFARSMRENLRQEALRSYQARKERRKTPGLDEALLSGLPREAAEDWTIGV